MKKWEKSFKTIRDQICEWYEIIGKGQQSEIMASLRKRLRVKSQSRIQNNETLRVEATVLCVLNGSVCGRCNVWQRIGKQRHSWRSLLPVYLVGRVTHDRHWRDREKFFPMERKILWEVTASWVGISCVYEFFVVCLTMERMKWNRWHTQEKTFLSQVRKDREGNIRKSPHRHHQSYTKDSRR